MKRRGVAGSDMTTGDNTQHARSRTASTDSQGHQVDTSESGQKRSAASRPRTAGSRRHRAQSLGPLRTRSAEPLTASRSQDFDQQHHHSHHQLGERGQDQRLHDTSDSPFSSHHCAPHQTFTRDPAHHHRLYHSDQNVYHHHHQHQHHLHRHQFHDHSHSSHHDPDPDPPLRRRRRHRSRSISSSSISSSNVSSAGRRQHHHQQQQQEDQRHDHPHLHRQRSSDSATSESPSEQSRRPRSRSECRSRRGGNGRDRMSGTNLSFCGCGFLGIYHLGVATCLVKHGPGFLAAVDRIAGASAGALLAALLVSSPSNKQMIVTYALVERLVRQVRRKPLGALTPGYQLSNEVEKLADRLLPADAHLAARGRLHVSLTNTRTKQNEVVSDFESRAELIEALVASCHIPVYSGARLPFVRGQHYCDGGLTDNMVRFQQGRTITVSPFSGKQDIGPHDDLPKGKGYFINLHNQDIQVNFNNVRRFGHSFFPPKFSVLQQYFELGHKDASRFLIREGLYEITKPGDKQSVVYESSV